MIAIWLHLSSNKPTGKIFLQVGVSIWTLVTLLHWIYFIFRNFVLGRSLASARVVEKSGSMHVTIKVPRPWDVKPGQYIFLTIPAAGSMSRFQGHPFMIVWWEHNVDGLTISLLVKPRHGFTRKLLGITGCDTLAFIDGPYGYSHDLGEYGTVLMFATGIGIAGHLSYLKDLIRGYNSCEVRTRCVILVWQLDNEGNIFNLMIAYLLT
jgi:predicted ferric reductase